MGLEVAQRWMDWRRAHHSRSRGIKGDRDAGRGDGRRADLRDY
ncbi:rCG34199 [Rattus norvegicus]|uniref:RCG34199 n=1 Tax=Rattus norvegicus TaxID=10116 RepID=A6HDJ7_RAT|nr:rCG34199 [Rattus norvegicus]